MESDLYGTQKRVWKMLRASRREINETVQINNITAEKWTTHFRELYAENNNKTGNNAGRHRIHRQTALSNTESEPITATRIRSEMRKLKNGKAPGPDNIRNELLKYGGNRLAEQFKVLYNKIIKDTSIPEDWRESITVPLFKKGNKSDPENYRGITLLNSSMKLFTRILGQEYINNIELSEEQQGFRKNHSTIDAIFIVRQIAEKALEYNKPSYLCFVDLTKAFDKVRLQDVVKELQLKNIHTNIIETIKQLNINNTTTIRTRTLATQQIKQNAGIRQGDSLSPQLFNLLMDRIITKVREAKCGYGMGNAQINIVCYADDAVLLADNEDDLQKLVRIFAEEAGAVGMEISINKTKTMVIAREPHRCKIVIDDKIIEQVMEINYLGIIISAYGDLRSTVKNQVNKSARIAGALKSIIWRNNCISKKSKVRIYKACVRPVMTYAAETRADTTLMKRMYRTSEMKVLRAITGNTLMDRRRSSNIQEECQTKDVVRWVRARRRE